MPVRLINRQSSIPNGLRFAIPGLPEWKHPPQPSFNVLLTSAKAVLQANPHLVQKLGWDISDGALADRIDEYNAGICKILKYTDYYTDSGPGGAAQSAPFTRTMPAVSPSDSLLSRLGNVAAGGKHIVETLASKEEAVPHNQAVDRAAICAQCPQNDTGDWLSYFTVPVSEAIRTALNVFGDWNLRTPLDPKLGICNACDCPMRLKVHFPIQRIAPNLKPDQKEKLWEKCWIKQEAGL